MCVCVRERARDQHSDRYYALCLGAWLMLLFLPHTHTCTLHMTACKAMASQTTECRLCVRLAICAHMHIAYECVNCTCASATRTHKYLIRWTVMLTVKIGYVASAPLIILHFIYHFFFYFLSYFTLFLLLCAHTHWSHAYFNSKYLCLMFICCVRCERNRSNWPFGACGAACPVSGCVYCVLCEERWKRKRLHLIDFGCAFSAFVVVVIGKLLLIIITEFIFSAHGWKWDFQRFKMHRTPQQYEWFAQRASNTNPSYAQQIHSLTRITQWTTDPIGLKTDQRPGRIGWSVNFPMGLSYKSLAMRPHSFVLLFIVVVRRQIVMHMHRIAISNYFMFYLQQLRCLII